jgi:HD-like signal output (HDOD) protein
MKRILFVDDDANILTGLRRSLRGLRNEWEMVFAEGASTALEQCALAPFDVVVSDARMPGMEGSEFLGNVMQVFPDTVRMILSGQCSRDSVLKCVGVAHQFLSKPCDAATLKATIQRICGMREIFRDGSTRRTVACVQWLPSRPCVYAELAAQMDSERASIEHVAEIVARDVAMSAKVVQLVSSGFFGTPQRVGSAAQAATLLGLETLKALWASSIAFRPCSAVDEEMAVERLTAHSLAVAMAAKRIARSMTDDRAQIGDSYMAGLLHEVGALALGKNWEAQGEERCPDLGGYFVALWGLPDAVVHAIAYHHVPSDCSKEPVVPLTALHVANALVEPFGSVFEQPCGWLDMDYLRKSACASRVEKWRGICAASQPEGALQ